MDNSRICHRPIKNKNEDIIAVSGIARDITERKRVEESLKEINNCLLGFGPNSDRNIKKVVEVAGSILGGICALYNKEDGNLLYTMEGWNIPKDLKRKDRKEGHICFDVITKRRDEPFVINDLDKSSYAKTDPNVFKYKLKTYIGCAVKINHKAIGSLCVVFQKNKRFNSKELSILSILAKAIGIEEERKKTLETLKSHQKRLKTSEKNLKDFSRRLLSIREEEKKKLSHNLHDEIGSMTVALGSNLDIIEEEIKQNNLQDVLKSLKQTKSMFKQSVEKLKKMSIDLRPPNIDTIGISNVLEEFFSNIIKQTKIKIDFYGNLDDKKINEEMSIILYRVTQEALNNIAKHSKAKKVKVRLFSDENNIILTINDDGMGFDVEKTLQKTKGLGIQGMRERIEHLGGSFHIKSTLQKGTELVITFPKRNKTL